VNNPFTGSTYIHERAPRENVFPRAIRGLRRALAQFRRTATLAGALMMAAPHGVYAQSNPARPRVTDRVDITRLSTLSGNTHPLARAQYDQGAAPPDLPMDRILLVLKRGPDQESALQDLLEQQQVTSSPTYHKWLTPEQFGQQFGSTDADIQAVTSWLASFGFQSIKVSKGRTVIEFSGTASQVEAALHAQIHRYVVDGEAHWANAGDPQIPAALAPVVSGLVSLHDFRKKPAFVRSGRTVTTTVTPGAKPQVNVTNSQNQTEHAVAPADFNKIYNVTTSTMTGSGATIGVIARTNINVSDVNTFRSLFGLIQNDPQIVLDGPDPGDLLGNDEVEAVLDATWSGAVAPSATVRLVVSESTNAVDGIDLSEIFIIDNNLADIMTESFSFCETGNSSIAPLYSALAEQAAAQGITYLVASGDGGPDGCDAPSTVPTTPTTASVNLLAATPFTIAVGGTQFNDTASPSTYWQTTNGADSLSAKSYIPENVWNESCTVAQCGSSLAGLWSSGGGQSTIFSKPPWQSGVTGIPSTNARFVPDVSLTAADHDGYVLCLDGSCQGSSPGFAILSGTSASVQSFGGVMALVVQQNGRQGQANYVLYKLASAEPPTIPANSSCDGSSTTLPASTCIFNDVTMGNTNIPGETGFAATTGYDKATGLGSVNVSNLVTKWSTAVLKASTTALTLNGGSAVNISHGASVPVSIAVAAKAPATGTPTGDVSLIATFGSGAEPGVDAFTLSSGSASSNTTLLPGGTYNVTAHYAGDGTFTGSDSTPAISVTVNPESSKTGLGIVTFDANGNITNSNATSIVYGSPYILAVSVTNAAGTTCNPPAVGGPPCPTGSVSLTDGANALDGGSFKLNSLGKFEDQPIQLPAGIHIIKAVYAGDNSFSGSASTTDVVTVMQAATTISVAATPTTASAGQTVTLTATVATQSNAIANASQEPTGNVQFFLGGVAFGAPIAVTGGATSSGAAQAVASMPTTTLANGSNSITAKYLGDSNYAASSVSSPVTVNVGTSGINVSPGCISATITITAAGQAGSCLITVTGANGFSGSVTLTCGVSTAPPGAVYPPTCSFGAPDSNFTAPATITLSAGSETGTATLMVNSTAKSDLFKPLNRPHGTNWLLFAEFGSALACMFLLTITSRKRRRMVTLAAVLLMFVAVVTGCGNYGGGNTGGGIPGTTLGAYTVTVTAKPAGGTAQSAPITVNVN
jgi:hypothetical protein